MSAVPDPSLDGLDRCGCCEGVGPSTPLAVSNRPGLRAIAYRSGTWHEFRASLMAALARDPALAEAESLTGDHRAVLGRLKTRSERDFSIALLDATAAVADVLTFYDERIANESYLRTATERRSVFDLARLIGYELRPGVAAETYLAFTLENADGAPGVATIERGSKVQSVPGQGETAQTFETVDPIDARAAWNELLPQSTVAPDFPKQPDDLWLDGVDQDVRTGDWVLIVGEGRAWDARRVQELIQDIKEKRTRVLLGSAPAHLPTFVPIVKPAAFVLRTRAAVFGANAPDWSQMSDEFKASVLSKKVADLTDDDRKGNWPGFDNIWSAAVTAAETKADTDLDAVYPTILPGGWLLLATPDCVRLFDVKQTAASGQAKFSVSSKTTRVWLEGTDFQEFSKRRRDTLVMAGSQALRLTDTPRKETDAVGPLSIAVGADVSSMERGRTVLIAGQDPDGHAVAEAAVLDSVATDGHTLVFRNPLRHAYQLKGLKVSGNVARATHGETVKETLGGGDAGRPFQQFTLKQPPLTYVHDPAAPNGAVSTLKIWVNEVPWQPAPSFYAQGPTDRVFVTRRTADDASTIQFGDGSRGTRLPTGVENVRATYRKGSGLAGNMRAGRLTTALTGPPGLKSVINPVDATGGDDPEPLDRARQSAPLTVLTLDRVVSLRDYEDFARGYVGFAKALATWSWDGERRGVFITVAGPKGAVVADDQLAELQAAIRLRSDPYVGLRTANCQQVTFRVTYNVGIQPGAERRTVEQATVEALRNAFSFAAREFGQAVGLAEVIATIQRVSDVVAVDVDSLTRLDRPAENGLVAPLRSALPEATSLATISAAELLMLAAEPIQPGVIA